MTDAVVTILSQIQDKSRAQYDIAMLYADCIDQFVAAEAIDFSAVNAAIMARWSKSGLTRIKKTAWTLMMDRVNEKTSSA